MSRTYELPDDEKAALKYNLVYFTSVRKDHPELFGESSWDRSFWRRLNTGEKSLKSKGILDRDRNPTDKAYEVLSTEALKEMLKELRGETMKLEAKRAELKAKCETLEKLEKYKLISEIANKFTSLGIDENWIAVLVSTNLIEQAMKKKLEDLGSPFKGRKFGELVKTLGDALKQKEDRKLKSLIRPNELYDVRSKIVHAGYKENFSHDEAQAIFVF